MSAQVLVDCRVATLIPQPDDPLGIVRDAALVWEDEQLRWIGPRRDLPELWKQAPQHEAQGAWVTPGLIDCHTHLVWGGSRAEEFRMRLHGASYEDIARMGGGIVSTVKATRAANATDLQTAALKRLDALLAEGVTTVEIKSGYGLDAQTEAKCLRVARQLAQVRAVSVRTTFLGAHALPPEFADLEPFADWALATERDRAGAGPRESDRRAHRLQRRLRAALRDFAPDYGGGAAAGRWRGADRGRWWLQWVRHRVVPPWSSCSNRADSA